MTQHAMDLIRALMIKSLSPAVIAGHCQLEDCDFNTVTVQHLRSTVEKINLMPRKLLNWKSLTLMPIDQKGTKNNNAVNSTAGRIVTTTAITEQTIHTIDNTSNNSLNACGICLRDWYTP
jgi:hypothetical protein